MCYTCRFILIEQGQIFRHNSSETKFRHATQESSEMSTWLVASFRQGTWVPSLTGPLLLTVFPFFRLRLWYMSQTAELCLLMT